MSQVNNTPSFSEDSQPPSLAPLAPLLPSPTFYSCFPPSPPSSLDPP